MFAPDSRVLARMEPVVRRTLIVDPNLHAARLLVDIMKGLGARDVAIEADEKRALMAAREMEPGLIFTERGGAGLDGEAFTRQLRRSVFACRRAPVIMVTADATASSIKGARDVGVHEFLRKPFTSADLFRRVENVALKPRDWIEGVGYVGPDRRRFNSAEYAGPQKRNSDKPASREAEAAMIKDQALRILASALDQFDSDPMQAVRAVRQQAETLKALGMKRTDTSLVLAASGLEACLASGPPTRASLTRPIGVLLALADAPLARTG